MSVNLYRLYAIQDFGKRIDTGGEKVAVYVCDGNFPDVELINDAEELVQGLVTRRELILRKPWKYDTASKREDLVYYTKVLLRARQLIDKNGEVKFAIFVPSTNPKEWHGTKTLYRNDFLDEVKSDTPQFSGCKPVKQIKL